MWLCVFVCVCVCGRGACGVCGIACMCCVGTGVSVSLFKCACVLCMFFCVSVGSTCSYYEAEPPTFYLYIHQKSSLGENLSLYLHPPPPNLLTPALDAGKAKQVV